MKRLTLFAVLAASLLAWAAPSSAKNVLLYYKADSIWARVGNLTATTGGLLSEAGKFRHSLDSTGVLRNAGNCVRFWINVVQLPNPNAVGGADTTATMFFSIRARAPNDPSNDTLAVELPTAKPQVGATLATASPLDSLTIMAPTVMGTDSTCAWNETGVQLGSPSGSTWMFGGRPGRHITFGNGYYGEKGEAVEFRWRVAGKVLPGTTPKLVFYKLWIYGTRED